MNFHMYDSRRVFLSGVICLLWLSSAPAQFVNQRATVPQTTAAQGQGLAASAGYRTGLAQGAAVGSSRNNQYWNPYYYGGYQMTPQYGYLSGSAEVINAQGQFLQDRQQAQIMGQQVKAEKTANRRRAIDEYLYELNVLPTPEDMRERERNEAVKRSRNDPPLTEIWSGLAMNNLLKSIQILEGKQAQGPVVYLDQDMLPKINLTGGTSGVSLGILKNEGKLDWPLALSDDGYEASRKTLDELCATAYREATYGKVQNPTLRKLTKEVDNLQLSLRENVAKTEPNEYVQSKKFLNDLAKSVKSLQDPNVSNYVNRKWAARGNTVSELVQHISGQGLRFAPATPGDEPAYASVHRAMATYESGMSGSVAKLYTPEKK